MITDYIESKFPYFTEFNEIASLLSDSQAFKKYKANEISRFEFRQNIEAMLDLEIRSEYDKFVFYPRIILNDEEFVDQKLKALQACGFILHASYNKQAYNMIIRALGTIPNISYKTFIHPEEARLTFALAQILRPDNLICLGSFFGFWGCLATAGARLANPEVKSVLVDLDKDVCAAASTLIAKLGLEENISLRCGDAFAELDGKARFDAFLLDAETPKSNPDKNLRDKAIYAPLLSRAKQCANIRAWVLAHNILFTDNLQQRTLKQKLDYNHVNMSAFQILVKKMMVYKELDTCEGMGFYRW